MSKKCPKCLSILDKKDYPPDSRTDSYTCSNEYCSASISYAIDEIIISYYYECKRIIICIGQILHYFDFIYKNDMSERFRIDVNITEDNFEKVAIDIIKFVEKVIDNKCLL
jgi:hypothetical protein